MSLSQLLVKLAVSNSSDERIDHRRQLFESPRSVYSCILRDLCRNIGNSHFRMAAELRERSALPGSATNDISGLAGTPPHGVCAIGFEMCRMLSMTSCARGVSIDGLVGGRHGFDGRRIKCAFWELGVSGMTAKVS
jgi:hypothetical protein